MNDLMGLHELGRHLAADDLEPPADLRRRILTAAARQRVPWYRRHTRPLVLAGAAVATCAAVVSPVVLIGHPPQGRPVGSGSSFVRLTPHEVPTDCDDISSLVRPLKDASALLYLPPVSLTGPVTGKPIVRQAPPGCVPTTTGETWYSLGTGDKVIRRITITGPNSTDPFAQPNPSEASGGSKSSVTVNNLPATLYDYDDAQRLVRLFWTTPDGSHWHADGTGMTKAQVIHAAETLAIDGHSIDETVAPAGLTHRLVPQEKSNSVEAGMIAVFDFHSPNVHQWFTIRMASVETDPAGAEPAGAPLGARAISINGVPGWLTKDPGSKWVSLAWAPAKGVEAWLSLEGTPTQAIALARATKKVTPDDSRLR